MKSLTLKKIIPTLLIAIILFTGFFGVFGVGVVNADNHINSQFLEEEGTIFGNENDPDIFLKSTDDGQKTSEKKPAILNETDKQKSKSEDEKFKEILQIDAKAEKKYQDILNDPNSTDEDKKRAKEERDAVSKKIEDEKIKTDSSCTWYWWSIKGCIEFASAFVGGMILGVFSLFVGIAGWVLDKSVTFTIIEMGDNARKIGAIEEGWKVFRDLSNIVIIFVLLIIGIATILRIEGYNTKTLLARLIIVALFINFSLFFTQVVIDSSNLISLQFYNNIRASGTISEQYMNAFKLTTLYNTNGVFDPQILVKGLTFYQIFLVSILGSVVFLVVAFALLAGAFLLISRFVMLVFLMILAPLAFVGMVLPSLSKHASKWLSMLMSYAFFAPTYMILTWFVLKVINSPSYKLSIGLQDGVTSFSKIGAGGATAIDSISIIFNFIVIIVFIIASILISNYMGIKGSKTVMKWGGSLTKWGRGMVGGATFGMGGRIMRNTVGRGASKMADSAGLKSFAAKKGIAGFAGRAAFRATRGVAGSSFDARDTSAGAAAGLGKAGGKGGYEAKLKAQIKSRDDFAKSLGADSLGEKLHKEKLAGDIKVAKETSDRVVEKENLHKEKMKEDKEKLGGVFKNAQEKEEKITIELKQAELQETKDNLKKKLDAIIEEKEEAKAKLDASERDGLQKLEAIAEEKNRAQALLTTAEEAKQRFMAGMGRQKQYADSLSEDKILGIPFLKVPRKGKEASVKIKKSIREFPNKKILDEIARQMKLNDSGAGEAKEKPEGESGATT